MYSILFTLYVGITISTATGFYEPADKEGLSKYYKVPAYKVYEHETDQAQIDKLIKPQTNPIKALSYKPPVFTVVAPTANLFESAQKEGISKYYDVPVYKLYDHEIGLHQMDFIPQPTPIKDLVFLPPNPVQTNFNLAPVYKPVVENFPMLQPADTLKMDHSYKPVASAQIPIQDHSYKPVANAQIPIQDHSYKPVASAQIPIQDHEYKPVASAHIPIQDHSYKPVASAHIPIQDHSYKPVANAQIPIQAHEYKLENSYQPYVYKVEPFKQKPAYQSEFTGATSFANVEHKVSQQAYRLPNKQIDYELNY